MTKFKVGDKIRRVTESNCPYQFGEVGRVYEVLRISPSGNPIIISKDHPGADATCFELVTSESRKGICAFIQRVEKEYSR